MEAAGPGHPDRDTGLPPGVEVGSLGRRVAAYLIEAIVPAIVAVVLITMLPGASGAVRGVLSIVGALVSVAWALTIWYLLAERAAGPGMRLMKLQLVGFYDGRPIGWVRVLLRALVFAGLAITGVGLVVMLVFLVLHPRKQGWHDLVAKTVVIRERVLAAPVSRASVAQQATFAPEPSPALSGGPGPSRGQDPAMRQAPATYGPAPRYSPVPGAYDQGPPPIGPPPGVGDPPQADQPRPPAPLAPPVAPAGATPGPPSAPEPSAGQNRPLSTPSAPPAAEPTPATLEWSAVLDDGRRLVVDHLVLLGRNPQPSPGEEDAELIKVADDTRTVSKLHLAVGVDPAGLYVVDRGSTNGSTVTTPNGATRRCAPGEVVYVSAGSIVSMGEHWLEVRRDG